MRKKTVILLFLILTVPLFLLRGEEPNDGQKKKIKISETIVVTAKAESDIQNPATTTISPAEIKLPQLSQTVAGLLEGVAGVTISRQGVIGGTTSAVGGPGAIQIRGFNESRSLIMVDGRPIGGAGVYGGFFVDFSTIPNEGIARIEVIRGAGSAKYGSTLGGMINIITKEGSEIPHFSFASSLGVITDGKRKSGHYLLTHSYHLGGIYYFLSLGKRTADPYLRNNDFSAESFFGKASTTLFSDLHLSFSTSFSRIKRGFIITNRCSIDPHSPLFNEPLDPSFPAASGDWFAGVNLLPGYSVGDGSYYKMRAGRYDLIASKPIGEKNLVNLHLYMNRADREEHYFDSSSDKNLILERTIKVDRSSGLIGSVSTELRKGYSIEWGGEGRWLTYDGVGETTANPKYFPAWALPQNYEDYSLIRIFSGFVQGNFSLTPKLIFGAGLRYDYYRAVPVGYLGNILTRNGISPKLILRYGLSSSLSSYFTVNRALRFPLIPEFYWWNNGYQTGRDLLPESGLHYEGGVSKDFGDKGKLRFSLYHYRVSDYIRTIFGYRPSRVVYNIDRAEFTGAELEGSLKPFSSLILSGSYSWLKTKKVGDILDTTNELSDELVELPNHQLFLRAFLDLPRDIFLSFSLRFVGERKVVAGNLAVPGGAELLSLKSYTLINIRANYPLFVFKGMRGVLSGSVENIANTRYEELFGFPMPGRRLVISFRFER